MKYQRKPLIVDAERFDSLKILPFDIREIHPHWTTKPSDPRRFQFTKLGYVVAIHFGDYIITDPDGDRYVIPQKLFYKLFDPVVT